MKDKSKDVSVSRYGWIVFVLSVVIVAIVVNIFKIKYKEGEVWRKVGQEVTTRENREILPNRGNIYSYDGRLLATSEPLYGVYMDFMAEGIKEDTLRKYVDLLSESLSAKFKDKTKAQYKKIFTDNWALSRKELAALEQYNRGNKEGKKPSIKTRYVRIVNRDINYLEMKEVYKMPFFNQRNNRSGLSLEEKTTRMKPFGRIAGRTVGSIYKDISKGGSSGLELKFDSILKGKPGIRSRKKVQGRWIDVVEVEAEDGWDLKTTLDVDIQDLTEQALYDKLVETKAESGTAIVMETATGEIKALVNLDRLSEGVYAEGNPNAFSYMAEPGSTFKTISLMVALEDGVVTPNDSLYVGNGLFTYNNRVIRDHDWRRGRDKGYLSITEGMETSSNVLVSKMILKGYEKNRDGYVQKIHDLGITAKIDWDVPLEGKEGTTQIRFPDDKSNPWSKITLPWMSFGYETQVPPIYMLMFYNGIANNGRMVKPYIAKALLNNGNVENEFGTEVINPALCSEKTLKEVQDILRKVVANGTGKAVDSKLLPISGKTGTAMIAAGGGYSGYYVSFCGYFPSDNPKYTCFVGIRRPQGSPSGGLMPGTVFKRIAEGIYEDRLVPPQENIVSDSLHIRLPKVKSGLYDNTKLVLDKLNQSYSLPAEKSQWITASADSLKIELKNRTVSKETVPYVIGMGAKDALFLLEESGLQVTLSGSGKVSEQSIKAGNKLVKGAHIVIRLN